MFGTEFGYEPASGQISDILRATASYGKIAVLEELEGEYQITPDHTIYVGDGSSDLYVMHHVNSAPGIPLPCQKPNPSVVSPGGPFSARARLVF